MNKRILIDTHIWLWHLNGDPTLPPRMRKMIDVCAGEEELYLSAISIWEVAMLASKKKIQFNVSCRTWINKSLALPGISLIPLSPEIAIESCELPGNFHGDPADRIIVASAKVENLSILSRDEKMANYCRKHKIDLIVA